MQRKIDDQSRLETLAPAAPTEAPTLAGAAVARRSWRARGAAAGVIALALGLAGCGGGSDNNDTPPPVAEEPAPAPVPPPVETPAPPAEVPPPVETPAPPPAADPTPAGFTKAGDVTSTVGDIGDVYKDSTNTRTVVLNAANNRYYEVVTKPLTWAAAEADAVVLGGKLASPSDAASLLVIKLAFGTVLPLGGAASGSNGAWVGLQQAPSSAAKDAGWTFVDSTALPPASPFWNPGEPNDAAGATEGNLENFAAIFAGMTAAETDLKMFYDAGATGSTDVQPMYVLEFENKAAVK